MFLFTLRNYGIISFILLGLLIQNGLCLSCYSCSSKKGGDCDHPINEGKVYKQKCSFYDNRCFVVNRTNNGYPEIKRGCSDEYYCPGNTRVFSTGCSDCSWDLCNSASWETYSWILILFFTTTIIFIK